MKASLMLLKQIAEGIGKQFGKDCEVVIHDLTTKETQHSIISIINGHVTGRQLGDGPSKIVLETLQKQANFEKIEDHIGYLTRTSDGRILKSSTMYIHGENEMVDYILSINYDITSLLAIDSTIASLVSTEIPSQEKPPESIVSNVNDLLDQLIEQSIAIIGKPVPMMNKDEKVAAITFLNDAGAFLITKSGDKVSSYFGISKYTLYSYMDSVKSNSNASKYEA